MRWTVAESSVAAAVGLCVVITMCGVIVLGGYAVASGLVRLT